MTLRPSIVIFLFAMLLALSGEVIYQGVTIETQAHTIQEQLGVVLGPDSTPQPPQVIVPPHVADPADSMPQRIQSIV